MPFSPRDSFAFKPLLLQELRSVSPSGDRAAFKSFLLLELGSSYLSKEDPRTLARYTSPTPKVSKFVTADDEFSMRKLLLARRLVEEGVRCVSVAFSDFDTHSSNFDRMRHMLPILASPRTRPPSLTQRGARDIW